MFVRLGWLHTSFIPDIFVSAGGSYTYCVMYMYLLLSQWKWKWCYAGEVNLLTPLLPISDSKLCIRIICFSQANSTYPPFYGGNSIFWPILSMVILTPNMYPFCWDYTITRPLTFEEEESLHKLYLNYIYFRWIIWYGDMQYITWQLPEQWHDN